MCCASVEVCRAGDCGSDDYACWYCLAFWWLSAEEGVCVSGETGVAEGTEEGVTGGSVWYLCWSGKAC